MWSASSAAGWGDCSKVKHLKEISTQLNLPYGSMVFFDNEMRNIKDISPLGVTCGYCPDGMTLDILRTTLIEHSESARRRQ
jgi:magnesium-dependent phosphatase 1